MRTRTVWIGLAILLGVLLLGAAWAGWMAYRVNQDLTAAVDDVTVLRAAIEDGDDAASDAALSRLEDHSGASADRTGGVTWSVLEHLPAFGDDARGVAVVSSVVDDLTTSGIRPLVQVSGDLESIVPSGGKIDPSKVEALQEPTATANAAFAAADRRLSAEDSSGYVERLRTKYRELARQVNDASAALASANTAVKVLPTMLGADSPQNYLLVFQNNAEIRATGGLPGAVSLVRADQGAVSMTRQVAASSFGYTDEPVLPLTSAEEEIYGDILGTFFLNANLQPDFSRASDLWKARWEQVYPEKIDGVLSIDPVAISYLLAATGPVEVDGVKLSEDNVVDELLHDTYVRYADPAEQDAFFRAVASAMFDKISSGTESPRDLIAGLARGADEHRLFVHDFDDTVQAGIEGTAVAGDLVTDAGSAPQVGVYLTDGTGSKMSYFLRYDVNVDATYCTNEVQGLSGHMRLASEAPLDAASLPRYITGGGQYGVEPGNQSVFVYLYAPVGGGVSGIALNGRPVTGFPSVDYEGREVFTAVVELKPQQKADLTWRMKSGPGQTSDVQVAVTPSIRSGSSSTKVHTAC
ncbi:hypothetical protein ASC77_07260 [Nocardioides sp. Root1257]|uniref:DUF4012 domain-containing protein n=1 Tax=unclassified Nocardioides TaxID=2615069 RepID=UPI0006FFBE36|nr:MULTISPECIES: DUF4012 domain-containing protein [unclassified Nocardioides]KQW48541.1 hypothetical protein ASC77_07260 [Nocardioides sp. Root1257]KRC47717.1 hypothetical protein ASE24_07265 [Nocardioides sp. Root224]